METQILHKRAWSSEIQTKKTKKEKRTGKLLFDVYLCLAFLTIMCKKQKNVLQIVARSWSCIVCIFTIWLCRQTANGWIISTTNLNIIFRLFSQAFTQGFSDLSEGALRDYNDAMVSHSTIQWSLFSVQLLINRWTNVLLPELETMTSWKWIWMMKRRYGMSRHSKKKHNFFHLKWITFAFQAWPVLPVSESGRRAPCRGWRCCCWTNFISI